MNAVRHGAALAGDRDAVARRDLPDEVCAFRPSASSPAAAAAPPPALRPLADVERDHILAVLGACGGHQAEAARVLGIGRNTLWRKLELYRRAAERPAE